MPGGRRRDAAVAVGRGCGDAAAERVKQRLRNRMRWNPQRDGVLTAGDEIADARGALQDQRERAWPVARRETLRGLGDFARPLRYRIHARKMDDQRVAVGTTLGGVDLLHRLGVRRI